MYKNVCYHLSSNILCPTNLSAFSCIYLHTFELHEHNLFAFMHELVAYVMCYVCLWLCRCVMNYEFCSLFIEVVLVCDQLAGLFSSTK